MATDATESEGSLKQSGTSTRVVMNKSSGESDTPRISAPLGNESSRGAARGGDGNAVTADCTPRDAISSSSTDEPVLCSPSDAEEVQEESSHEGQGEEPTQTRSSSSPVTLPRARSAPEHNGR